MTPIIDEICDEVLTADNDIAFVKDVEEFMCWCELLDERIRRESLRFEFPNFKLYSTMNGARYYWPFIQKRRDS